MYFETLIPKNIVLTHKNQWFGSYAQKTKKWLF